MTRDGVPPVTREIVERKQDNRPIIVSKSKDKEVRDSVKAISIPFNKCFFKNTSSINKQTRL